MAGILDILSQLTQPYQQAGSYIGQGASSLLDQLKSGASQGGSIGDSITRALNASSDDGGNGNVVAANQAAPSPTVASGPLPTAAQIAAHQGSVQDGLTDPQVIPISAQEAAAAQAQQGGSQAPSSPAPQAQAVDPGQVAQVNTDSSFPSASDYNADGTQAAPGDGTSGGQPAGGLLGSLAGAASDAVGDPVKSKGLLGSVGDAISGIGTQLKSLSPAASQGLIAAGMTMLANNNGRNNLSQLVGMGGTEGLNAYQQVNQNRIMMAKNAMDVQHMQNQDAVAASNAATEAYKAQHPYLTFAAGDTVAQPGVAGQPANIVATGGPKAAGTREIINQDGTKTTVATDTAGNTIPGTATTSQNADSVGPLTPEQAKTVNAASATATTQQQALAKTQALLGQLQNANIPSGLKAKGADLWTQVTGNQTTGQILRNQLQQQTYQDFLSTWKPGIGGRLTNTDVNLLKQGMPPDTASSQTWTKFMTSYGRLQADAADQSTRGAAFTAQNRGDQGVLHAPLTIGGVTYPQGSSYQQVVMGQGGTPTPQPGQNSQNGGNAALLAEAQRRGLKQNANGQWVVSSQSQ